MTIITLDTFIARATAEGWSMVGWDGEAGRWDSATFTQAGIRLSGTYLYPSEFTPEGGLCVNLARDRSWIAMAYYQDHSGTSFSLGWAQEELSFKKPVKEEDD